MTTIDVNVIEELLGQVLVKAEQVKDNRDDDEIVFTLQNGRVYRFFHHQSCCENVYVESIVGDLNDLVGSPIMLAEEVSGEMEDVYSGTWTFYKFATAKGYVDIRWIGTSNGCYSEEVSHCFDKIDTSKMIRLI
ncbi:MAG: hypothetical protein P4L77_11680 [Sulfuriferula sp.]|nr:hypothetical protein [Sulfuriferula sp.]